jgi:histidinol phosphatase-like PHP family hydrolase
MKTKTEGLINFHCHSLLSDGILLPSELVRRYEVAGFKAVAITDHADSSNIDFICSAIIKASRELNRYWNIITIPGIELTHIPTQQFLPLARYARKNGIKIIVGHGETPVEPVIKGTNRSAIEAGIDILAHPGTISKEDAKLAAKKGVYLEITTRRGHSQTNAHVAKIAKAASAKLILSSDSHGVDDIPNKTIFEETALSAGLSKDEVAQLFLNAEELLKKLRHP